MATQTNNTAKAGGTSPGEGTAAAQTAEGQVQQDVSSASQPKDVVITEQPAWVAHLITSNEAMMESNNAVIESNNAVVEAVAQFKEAGTDMIREVIQAAKQQPSVNGTVRKQQVVNIDPEAEYVVADGQSFMDKDTSKLYKAGEDVTHLEESRLQKLLSQGIIIEA